MAELNDTLSTSDRRGFLKAGTLATAAFTSSLAKASAATVTRSANAELVIGIIGPGGMGTNHLNLLAQNKAVKLAYLCDVDSERLAKAAASAESTSGVKPQTVTDMRRILDDPAVDAVWIATPDHWHAPASILAVNAGKHVYVEKPCSHNIREGRLMIEASRKSGKLIQVGTQSRSTAHIMAAVKRLQEGAIGEVLVAKAWNSQKRGSIGHEQPSDPPPYLDFDSWVGPAPMVPYQSNLLPGIWRWWYAFGCGDIGNDGVHDIDIARWGLGVTTHPNRIAALGGKFFFNDDQQHADTQYVVYEYDPPEGRKKQLVFEQRIWSPYVQEGYENGNAYYGTEGMLLLGKAVGYKLYGPRNKLIEEVTGGSPDLPAHHANFIEAITNGTPLHAEIAVNHLSTALCHLGNMATRVGRVINFDAAAEQVLNDEEANALVGRSYREHWGTPS